MIDVAHTPRACEHLTKLRLSFEKRPPSKILAAKLEEVEREKHGRHSPSCPMDLVGPLKMRSVAQWAELWPSLLVTHDELAVENERRKPLELGNDLGKTSRHVVAAACEEPNRLVASYTGERAKRQAVLPNSAEARAEGSVQNLKRLHEIEAELGASQATGRFLPRLRISASRLKAIGWRAVLELAEAHGGVLMVTSHRRPQAIILSPKMYERLASGSARLTALPEGITDKIEELAARISALEQQVVPCGARSCSQPGSAVDAGCVAHAAGDPQRSP